MTSSLKQLSRTTNASVDSLRIHSGKAASYDDIHFRTPGTRNSIWISNLEGYHLPGGSTGSMEQILKEHERLEKKGNLKKSIEDVQKVIDQLQAARSVMEAQPQTATVALAKVQPSIKQSFERVNDDLKEIYSGLNRYSKAMEKKFKESPVTFAEDDTLSAKPSLINRAIAMHLLREGHFDVASTFISEANANPPKTMGDTHQEALRTSEEDLSNSTAWEADFSTEASKSAALQQQFAEMYHILHELRSNQNLTPAIEWARAHSTTLEARGSNLAYDLCKLQYISIFRSTRPNEGPVAAITYARKTFPLFPPRYATQTHALVAALAFTPDLASSPYASLFSLPSDSNAATNAAAAAFTAEFCALLSLSSASPLFTAVTAGCIALPTMQKLSQIQALRRTTWTTAAELPVEIPLPSAYHFHSIFVCPVSKEQSTDKNPPMMMPCGHVIARESLDRLSRNVRFKCPYCPLESHPRDAKVVYL